MDNQHLKHPICQNLATTSHHVASQGQQLLHGENSNNNNNDDDDDNDKDTSSSTEDDMSEPSQHSLTILSGGIAQPSVKPPPIHTDPDTEDFSRRKDHKKRSKNWTRVETLKLIQARSELNSSFQKSGRKASLWDEAACFLQRSGFARDGQQCKDKWEKLTAGYKEVRSGAREKEDYAFYDELHPLLGWKSYTRRESFDSHGVDRCMINHDSDNDNKRVKFEETAHSGHHEIPIGNGKTLSDVSQPHASSMARFPLADVGILLETMLVMQQKFFKDVLEAVERKEEFRERRRQEMEEKWRAEERAQRFAFNNAMLILTQRLLGERLQTPIGTSAGVLNDVACVSAPPNVNPKKRSKNWKKSEVFCLIRLRREMENKFLKSTRRAGLWEELGEKLGEVGIARDGKQCREKWDKLMAEYKDVLDGKKDREESPYFVELNTFMGRPKEVEYITPMVTSNNDEYGGDD